MPEDKTEEEFYKPRAVIKKKNANKKPTKKTKYHPQMEAHRAYAAKKAVK